MLANIRVVTLLNCFRGAKRQMIRTDTVPVQRAVLRLTALTRRWTSLADQATDMSGSELSLNFFAGGSGSFGGIVLSPASDGICGVMAATREAVSTSALSCAWPGTKTVTLASNSSSDRAADEAIPAFSSCSLLVTEGVVLMQGREVGNEDGEGTEGMEGKGFRVNTLGNKRSKLNNCCFMAGCWFFFFLQTSESVRCWRTWA